MSGNSALRLRVWFPEAEVLNGWQVFQSVQFVHVPKQILETLRFNTPLWVTFGAIFATLFFAPLFMWIISISSSPALSLEPFQRADCLTTGRIWNWTNHCSQVQTRICIEYIWIHITVGGETHPRLTTCWLFTFLEAALATLVAHAALSVLAVGCRSWLPWILQKCYYEQSEVQWAPVKTFIFQFCSEFFSFFFVAVPLSCSSSQMCYQSLKCNNKVDVGKTKRDNTRCYLLKLRQRIA